MNQTEGPNDDSKRNKGRSGKKVGREDAPISATGEVIRKRLAEEMGGEGRITMDGPAMEDLVRSAFDDLVSRGVISRDPETGEFDLTEDIEKRKKDKEKAGDQDR